MENKPYTLPAGFSLIVKKDNHVYILVFGIPESKDRVFDYARRWIQWENENGLGKIPLEQKLIFLMKEFNKV